MSAREVVVEEPNSIPIGYITRDSTTRINATAAMQSGASVAAGIAHVGLKGVRSLAGGMALGGVAAGLDGAVGGLKRQGHIRYHLEVAGQQLATMRRPDPSNWGFVIDDPAGSRLATVTNERDGWKVAGLGPASHYVVQVHQPLEDPLRSLVITAALSIHIVEERA